MRVGIANRQIEDRRIDQPDHIDRRLPDIGAREREHIPKGWPAFCCIFAFGGVIVAPLPLDRDL